MKKMELTRRAFIAATTTTSLAACCTNKCNTAQVVPKKVSPNEKINVAGIGIGGMGRGDIMSVAQQARHVNIVALCDVDGKQMTETAYRLKDAKQFKDYRKMLETMGDEIDAVTVSTPDHHHAPATYQAMLMGKHVRTQKPLTHTIAEARLLAETAKKTGVVTAMGNQGHSGNGVRDLCEMVWDGAIGDVKEAHIWTNRPIWPQGIKEALRAREVPAHMAWDLWLGPAPVRGYNPGYAPFKWRGWWDFGCGASGDMACHIMDPAFWSLNLIEAKKFSCEVIEQEGMTDQCAPNSSIIKYEFPKRGKMGPVTVYWYDGGKLPKRPADISDSEKLGEGANGSLFVGTDGYITTGCYGGGSRILPREKMQAYKKPPQIIPRIKGENPYLDWIMAIKEGREAISHFAYAGPLTEVANMGNVALHAGGKIEFDVKSCKITNNKAANQYLTKEYRNGWELPC